MSDGQQLPTLAKSAEVSERVGSWVGGLWPLGVAAPPWPRLPTSPMLLPFRRASRCL